MLWSYCVEQNTPQTYTADEIDLVELTITLWKSKWLVLVITAIITAAAAAYAFLSTPVYEAQAQTLPPTPSGLASYNMAHQLSGPALATINDSAQSSSGSQNQPPDNSVPELSPADAYGVFLRHLGSMSLRQHFFETVYLPFHSNTESTAVHERLWKRLDKELTIDLPKAGSNDDRAKIKFDGKNPRRIASWTNQYLQMAIQASQDQILASLKSAITLRLQSISDQIATLRQVALMNRQNEIARLKNALTLAETINLNDPPSTGNLITSYTGTTTYLRGSKALKAELALLEKRASDDPYIPELPNLLKEQALLKKIDLNPRHLSVATVDQTAIPPEIPIKPKKSLIVVLGIILGLILGAVVAIIRQMWKKAAQKR